jgi:hypothetical protein
VKDDAVVRRTTVGALETLEPLLGPEQPAARVAIEACREAWFVHRKLTDWGNEVLLVDTTRSKEVGVDQIRLILVTSAEGGADELERAIARASRPGANKSRVIAASHDQDGSERHASETTPPQFLFPPADLPV